MVKQPKVKKRKCPNCDKRDTFENRAGDFYCRNCGYKRLSHYTVEEREYDTDFKIYKEQKW